MVTLKFVVPVSQPPESLCHRHVPLLPATLALLIIKAPCCLWPWEAFHLVSQRLWWTMITYWFCPLWRPEIDTYICVTIGCVVLFKKSLLPALEELLHVCTCVCENQDNLEESIFSFHLYVDPGDGTRGTRAVGLGSSRLGRPSRSDGPVPHVCNPS